MCALEQLRRVLALCFCVCVYQLGGNSVLGRPPEPNGPGPGSNRDRQAIEPSFASGSSAGFPKCETTGFEAIEPLCAWEAGFGICGSTFTCRNTAVDGPYPACTAPPTVQPDNCCVLNPHPVNEWFMSASAQHCQQPSISNNALTGTQALHFERSTLGGNPAGCTGFTAACRLSAFTPNANPGSPGTLFNPGVTRTSFDVTRDVGAGIPGMEIDWSNQSNSEGLLAQLIIFDVYGYVLTYDLGANAYGYMGAMVGGEWHHIETVHDICGDDVRYYFDGDLMYVAAWSSGVSQQVQSIEQSVWLASNAGGAVFNFDNFSVVRDTIAEPTCPCSCGDGNPCVGEECDFGPGGDDCCPGLCRPPGTPDECTCPEPEHSIFTCSAREIGNGMNGPYVSDGGFFSYLADAQFTSVSLCDSDFDSQIFWNLTPDCGEYETFNDDCWEDDYAGGQQPGDPNASCYGGAAPPPGYQACICNPTVPGTTYTFLVAEWAPASQGGTTLIPPFCSSTVIEITKKTSCSLGGPIPGGACCDQLTGLCTDGAPAAACAGPFQTYSDNKLCGMVECEALTGACCNTAPGAGGACVETTQADCPTTAYQSWTVGASCAEITCNEVTGSCCDGLTGSCSTTLQSQCGPASTWTEGGSCSTCVARTGACCVEPSVTEAICTDGQTLAQCNAAGGVWSDSQPCSAVECLPNFIPIPTVSEWGLLVLALILLVGGKVYWSRSFAATG